MRKTFAFNRILAFALVMVMVIIMVPTHFFPQAADEAPSTVSDCFIRNGDVSVEGKLPRGTLLKARTVDNPFAPNAEDLNAVSLRGASFINGISPVSVTDEPAKPEEPEILTYSTLNYIGFYDISLYKGGADVQPDGSAEVVIRNIDLSGVNGSVKVIHILDSEDAIRDAQKRGTAIWVNDTHFVKAFAAESKIAENVTGKSGIVIIEELNADVNDARNQITFNTNSFSIYAVAEEEEDNRLIVHFMNGEQEVETVALKRRDIPNLDILIYDPGIGAANSRQRFRGWSTVSNYTTATTSYDIAGVRGLIETELETSFTESDTGITKHVYYYAMMYKVYTINYLDENYVSLGYQTVILLESETEISYTVNMAYTPKTATQGFKGWNVYSGSTNINEHLNGDLYFNEQTITIKGDVVFSVEAPEGHWLIFDQNGKGGTYNAPVFYESDETTVRPRPDSEMRRYGYSFGGWYVDSACTIPFTFGNKLTDNTTIYAKWNANERANYTVIIWKQHVTGDTYDFGEAITLEGRVGNTVNTVSSTGTGNGRYASVNGTPKKYDGFHLKEYNQNVTITTEGDAVVNIYYDRDIITLNFFVFEYTYTPTNGNSGTQYGIVNGEYVELYRWSSNWYYGFGNRYSGTRYTRSSDWNLYKTMSGRYDSTLESNNYTWPTEYDWYSNGGNDGTTSGTRTTFLDAFKIPSLEDEESFYGRTAQTGSLIVFTKQNADKTGYVEANRVATSNANNHTFHISDKYAGFEAVQYRTSETGEWINVSPKDEDGYYGDAVSYGNYLEIRFNRLEYSITFKDGKYFDGDNHSLDEINQGVFQTISGITYGADISNYGNYEPEDVENFVFEGWYIDESCTQKYTFSTLPMDGITVYAKWRQAQYRVFLHPNVNSEDTTLDWGREDQEMNFRISSGGKLSAPTGRRAEYEFVGWFFDENCTKLFNADAFIFNDSTVTAPYNQNTDFTDPMDKWGNLGTNPYNSDARADRFWITKRFDVYGKWRAKLTGAIGIGIEYIAGEGTNAPSDTALYLDEADAYAGAAATPPNGKVFKYWIVQKWDGESGQYVDTTTTVYPGATFTVLKANAKAVQQPDSTEEEPKYTYTVRLRAYYEEKQHPVTVDLVFDANGGKFKSGNSNSYETITSVIDSDTTFNASVDALLETVSYTGLPVNQHFHPITGDMLSNNGRTFLGWAYKAGASDPVYAAADLARLTLVVDNLDRDAEQGNNGNDTTNTLYAVWGYTVTVKKIIDLPDNVSGVDCSLIGNIEGFKDTEFTVNPTISRLDITPSNGSFELTDYVEADNNVQVFEGLHKNDKFKMEEVADSAFTTTYDVYYLNSSNQKVSVAADSDGNYTITDNTIVEIHNVPVYKIITIKKTITNDNDNGKSFYFDLMLDGATEPTINDIEVSNTSSKQIAVFYGSSVVIHEDLKDTGNYEGGLTQKAVFVQPSDWSNDEVTSDEVAEFTNNRNTIKIAIKKVVENSEYSADYTTPFNFVVNGNTVEPISVKAGETSDWIEIEIGDAVTIYEDIDANSGFTTSCAYSINGVDYVGTIVNGKCTASIEGFYSDETVVIFTNARPDVTLTINKDVNLSDDADYFFKFRVFVEGRDGNEIEITSDNNLVAVSENSPKTIGFSVSDGLIYISDGNGGFAYGTKVRVVEVVDEVYEGSLTVAQAFNIENTEQTVELLQDESLTFVNTRNIVKVVKVFDDSNVEYSAEDLPIKFPVVIEYTRPDGSSASDEVDLGNEDEHEVYIKTGTDVSVTEPDLNTTYFKPLKSDMISVTTDEQTGIKTITVTNERDVASVTVTKQVEGTAKDFEFEVTATVDGKKVIFNQNAVGDAKYTYTFAIGETTTSHTIQNLPKGADLHIKEVISDADNGRYYTTVKVDSGNVVNSLEADVSGVSGTSTTVKYVNYQLQKVDVKKEFAADMINVEGDDDIPFTIKVAYTDETGALKTKDVTLKAGQTTSEPIIVRYGTDVTLKETAPTGFVAVSDATYNITEDKKVLVVTNKRDTVKVTVTKEVKGTNGSFTFNAEATLNGKAVTLTQTSKELGNDGKWEIEVPVGTTLTVSETGEIVTGYNTYIDGELDADRSVTVELSADKTIAFKNVELIEISFVKAFDNKGIETLPTWDAFYVSYTVTGVLIEGAYPVAVPGNGTDAAVVTVEYGTVLSGFAEDMTKTNAADIAVGTVYDADKVKFTVGDEDEVVTSVTADAAKTVTVKNTVKEYDLTIKKITDDGVNGAFAIALATTNVTPAISDATKSVTANGDGITFTLPYGAQFTLVENLTSEQQNYYGVDTPATYEATDGVSGTFTGSDAVFTITGDGTITITNFRNPVVVYITKTVNSPVDADKAGKYTFKYYVNGSDTATGTITIDLKPDAETGAVNNTGSFTVAAGSTVEIEEVIDTNAFTVVSTEEGQDPSNNVISVNGGNALTEYEYRVAFENTRNTFDVKVTKTVKNFDETGATYPVQVVVKYGEQTIKTVDLALIAGTAAQTVNNIPYGATVTLTENGDAKVSINGVEYAIKDAFTTKITGATQNGLVGTITNVTANQNVNFENKRNMTTATVTKTLDNKGVSDEWSTAEFKFDYTIIDSGNDVTGSIGVKAGETKTIEGIPFGATITVNEDTTAIADGQSHKIEDVFKVGGDNGKSAVAATTAPSFNIVNTRKIVKVKVVKEVLSDDTDDYDNTPYTFAITTEVASSYTGTDVDKSGNKTISIGSTKIGEIEISIPYGTDFKVEETGIDADKFETLIVYKNSTTKVIGDYSKSITDVAGTENTVVETVKYINRKLVNVTVKKIVDSTLTSDLGMYMFDIKFYDIDNGIDRNVKNNTANVTAFNTAASVATFQVPYGTTNLSVAEVLGDAAGSFRTTLTIVGATGTAGANNQSATVATVNVDTTITFTNTRKMQTITVEKTVDSLLAADLKAYTFTYGYKYYAVSGEQTVANATIDVTVSSSANPATATFQIPYDAHAFEISEPNNSGTTTVLTTVTGTGSLANGTASDGNRKYAVTANITADGKVSFTNRRVVYMAIRKILDSLDSGRTFSFKYNYTDTDGRPVENTVTIEIETVDAEGKACAAIEIPYGVEVTVTETTTNGYSTYVLVPGGTSTEATSGKATITSGTKTEPAEFVFTNHRVIALAINKTVDSDETNPIMSYTFAVDYKYNGVALAEPRKVTVTVADGETANDGVYIGSTTIFVPYGITNVVITETPVDGYDTDVTANFSGSKSSTLTGTGLYVINNKFTADGSLTADTNSVSYVNTRMVDVTVIKELDSEEVVTSFDYNYTYTGKNHNSTEPLEFNVTISANKQGTKVLHVPYGVTLTINELLSETEVSNKYYDTFWGVDTVGSTINAGNEGTTASNVGPVTDNTTAVKFSNKRMVNVKIIKNVDDPTLSTENNKYTFTYTYTYNNTTNTSKPVVITVDTTSATGNTGYFRIPYNAANFKVTETIVLSVFDVTATSTGTAGTLNGAAYTLSQNVTAVNTDITFNNQRMVEVKVVKVVESAEQADKDAAYSVTYGYTRTATGSIPAAVNVTGQTGTIKDATDGNTDGNLTVRMPYGSTLTVTETGDLSKFQVLYRIDNTALTEGKEVTLANVTAAKTVTFTNRKLYTVTVTKTVDNKNVNDGLQNAAFPFTYTVSNTVGYNVPATDNNGEFALTNNGPAKVITVPYGAKVVVSETTGAKINTLVAEVYYNTNYTVADFFTTSLPLTLDPVSANTSYEFSNVRKTRDIIVSKTVKSKVATDFTNTYVFNYTVDKLFGEQDEKSIEITPVGTNASIPSDGNVTKTETITVPVGLEVTVKESGAPFAGVETMITEGNGVTIAAGDEYKAIVAAGLGNVTVIFVNTRVTADLTITKVVNNGTTRTFIFSIDCADTGYHQRVMIQGADADGNSVTIKDLQTGYIYTVTELTGWSWEFNATAVNASQKLLDPVYADTKDAATFLFVDGGIVTFTNVNGNTNWLRTEAYLPATVSAN